MEKPPVQPENHPVSWGELADEIGNMVLNAENKAGMELFKDGVRLVPYIRLTNLEDRELTELFKKFYKNHLDDHKM